MTTAPLTFLSSGQAIPYGGDRVTMVSDDLAAAFVAGDRLVVVHESGDLLRIPAAEHERVAAAVGAAHDAFRHLAHATDEQLRAFFDAFAALLADDDSFAPVRAANESDIAVAKGRGRSTTRLELTATMRAAMVDGLRVWRDLDLDRQAVVAHVDHPRWSVETRRAPLGVVGFVFEGRPNVFADAAGVLRSGNTVVFRIGSDALGTARAIMDHAAVPALQASGLPVDAVQLIDSTAHSAGWALFCDARLGLAVARGSGTAVAQLGAVARQHGVPVSLHGTGGAWMVVAPGADAATVGAAVVHSLDRKVCNTLNVCCVTATDAAVLVPVVRAAIDRAAAARGGRAVVHADSLAAPFAGESLHLDEADLAVEWEWENNPEVSIVVVEGVSEAVGLFNRWSPRFTASLVGGSTAEQEAFYAAVDAPFVGDGFTRWVDGQFAFDQPELGLSNWQAGRLLARGGVLSGDSVYTIRTRATIRDHELHR